tara:strand:- start:121 stop:510 length:390 start_codon:yes stop_codon:yes gene_type:complete
MTFNNIPKELVTELCGCLDRIEAAIRTDERDRIVSKMRGTLFAEQVVQPLHESDAQPVELNSTHHAMIRWLSTGTFIAVPTLAGHLNIKKQSVYAYMSALRGAGYEIEKRSTGNLKGGYRNIYRLAKTG